jgi:hypothetical protein
MPNWCQNNIAISGDLNKFKTWLNGEPFSLNKIVPMDQILLEDEGWHNWRIENWGTKWDVDVEAEITFSGDSAILIHFNSAWAPPNLAIAKLSESFPEITIEHAYLEEGMCFVGKDVYSNGALRNAVCYEDPNKEEWKELATAEFNWEPYEE